MRTSSGTKIKGLASGLRILGYFISCFLGFFLLFDDDTFLFGFLLIIFGCITSWLGTILLEGFGELVENSHIIATHLTKDAKVETGEFPHYATSDLSGVDVSHSEVKRLMDEKGLPYGEAFVLAKSMKKASRTRDLHTGGDLIIHTREEENSEQYCKACGGLLLPDGKFCNHCGAPVT